MLRTSGRAQRILSVYDWSRAVQRIGVEEGELLTVYLSDGTSHEHAVSETGWQIRRFAQGTRSRIDLGGIVPRKSVSVDDEGFAGASVATSELVLLEGEPRRFVLGEAHYRRSEQSWRDARKPTADVTLTWTGAELRVEVLVPRSDLTFVAAATENPWDNENADVNGDGVQLYVKTTHGKSAWMLVPDERAVRARKIDGWTHERAIRTSWKREETGYSLVAEVSLVDLELEEPHVAVDVIINEKPAGRLRRRGQLVLSGGDGDFVYLRGDRHDEDRLVRLELMHG